MQDSNGFPDPDAGVQTEQTATPAMQHQNNETQQTNPLLQGLQRIPGETFRLPSLGMFYHNGELDPSVQDGEIHVYPMKTIDEILIKTPDKLFSGKAIEEVFNRCIPQVNKPLELLSADVDYLLVCLRKVSYGPEIVIPWQHDCEEAKQHDYQIDVEQFIHNAKTIDPTTTQQRYALNLENGQKITLVPPKFKDVLDLYQMMQLGENASEEEIEEHVINTLMGMIESVDDISQRKFIKEWLHQLPTSYVKEINNKTEEISDWGPNFETTVQCKDCGQDVQITTPINPVAFFT